jgi:hypothetical protein
VRLRQTRPCACNAEQQVLHAPAFSQPNSCEPGFARGSRRQGHGLTASARHQMNTPSIRQAIIFALALATPIFSAETRVKGGRIMRLHRIAALVGLAASFVCTIPASASETVTYTYDAKGRLIGVVHGGNVNNGVQTVYTYDPADNRTNVTVTGSTNTGGGQGSGGGASVPYTPIYVVVPLNGYTLIKIQ